MKKLEEFKITERIKKKILIGLMEQDYYGISCIFIPLTSDVGVKLRSDFLQIEGCAWKYTTVVTGFDFYSV
jgi:hypothetical protein